MFDKMPLARMLAGCVLLLTVQTSLLADAPKPADADVVSIHAALPRSAKPDNTSRKLDNATALGEGRWEAGSLSALDAGTLAHTFTLRNSDASPLTISRFQTSCDCTRAAITTGKGAALLPLTLAPGEAMTVSVSVNLGHVASGPFSKYVMLYSGDGLRPTAVLQIAGTLRPSLALSPVLLDFGQVPEGKGNALILTATWDERLTPGGNLPTLSSTNPDISVTPQPEIKALPSKTPGPSPFLHRGIRTRTYRVALSASAALGPISGTLTFQAPASSDALRSSIYAQPTALLLGQVSGELTAQPQVLTFDRVRLGQPASREIILTGSRLEVLKGLSVAAASPWLTAHLSPSTPVFSGGQLQATSQVLDVSLSPNTPPGMLSSTLKITLANGQHLRVPVTATVSNTGF